MDPKSPPTKPTRGRLPLLGWFVVGVFVGGGIIALLGEPLEGLLLRITSAQVALIVGLAGAIGAAFALLLPGKARDAVLIVYGSIALVLFGFILVTLMQPPPTPVLTPTPTTPPPTNTYTPTPTTPTPTNTYTPTPTPTETVTPTETNTGTPTDTPTATSKPTPTRTYTSTPTPYFQNFEKDNGTPPGAGNYFWDAWFTTCSFSQPPQPVHSGQRAVRVDAYAKQKGDPQKDTGGTMGINPSSARPIDLSSATTISIWVYDRQGNNTVQLKLRDYDERVSNARWSAKKSVKDQWTQITWNLADFSGVDMHRIKNIEIYEWNDGVYFFDDVRYE